MLVLEAALAMAHKGGFKDSAETDVEKLVDVVEEEANIAFNMKSVEKAADVCADLNRKLDAQRTGGAEAVEGSYEMHLLA